MSQPLTVQRLYDALAERLRLRWISSHGHDTTILRDSPGSAGHSLVGSLNCIHPNRVQVIGHAELVYLTDMGKNTHHDTMRKLFYERPAAIVFSDGIEPDEEFGELAAETGTALLGTSVDDSRVISVIHYYLTHELAERVTIHGVFLEVMGKGVLLTGDPAVGKSELALELISRGHRLIADDVPEFALIAPDTLRGTCPPLLRDFLEVRGLGIINVRAIFGDNAIAPAKGLHVIVHLRRMHDEQLAQMDRLEGAHSRRDILGVPVPQITVPVAPGRNLAILVEAAVRHHTLRLSGYHAASDFAERQRRQIIAAEGGEDGRDD